MEGYHPKNDQSIDLKIYQHFYDTKFNPTINGALTGNNLLFEMIVRSSSPHSSGAEHQSRKLGVESSILSVGSYFLSFDKMSN